MEVVNVEFFPFKKGRSHFQILCYENIFSLILDTLTLNVWYELYKLYL